MDDMILAIADAETRATEIKSAAVQKAGAIIEEARTKAADFEREQIEVRAKYRDDTLQAAESKSDEEFKKSIEQYKREAKEYADGIASSTDLIVGKIVGRVSGGNC
jgi:vacuolar-type H+-ATPase subunit H